MDFSFAVDFAAGVIFILWAAKIVIESLLP
jgi:hypothetical protein